MYVVNMCFQLTHSPSNKVCFYPLKIPEFTSFICIFYSMSNNTNVIHVQVSSVGDAQRVPVHLMPCEIEHNGPAQVSQYFHATTKDRKQGTCI